MAEAAVETKRIKKMWSETVDHVQTRIKGVEDVIKHSVEDLQARMKGASEDGKKRLETLKEQLKLDKVEEWVTQFRVKERVHDVAEKAQDLVDEGVKLTEETIDKLGLAKVADVATTKEALDKLVKRFETLRKRVSEMASKKDFKALVARVDEIEKKLDTPQA